MVPAVQPPEGPPVPRPSPVLAYHPNPTSVPSAPMHRPLQAVGRQHANKDASGIERHGGILSGNSSDESYGLVVSHSIQHPLAWRIARCSRSDDGDSAQSNEDLDSSAIIDDNDSSSSTSPVTGVQPDADRSQF